ncbi:MAG: ribonucleoside-triphosphate reductase, adenosylcobalamin-dependent [Hormoscilla sp. SP5CHS1]|nr:ribonucleoside-triphosphate reductase, adenosylcobalamin-dependent [Hormoscilla sp. SP5CHS1]
MVQQPERKCQSNQFPPDAPLGFPVFFRTYSRLTAEGKRESWKDVCDRAIAGLTELGKLTPEESDLLYRMQLRLKALSSGRWLWIGGTEWIKQPENFPGAYNCSSTNILDWRSFGLLMDLAMMGCGTGAVLEPRYINQLPPIRNHLKVKLWGKIGATSPGMRREETEVKISGNKVIIHVGDSRQGWIASYQSLLELSTEERFTDSVEVDIDLSDVRPAGEHLKGFGGVANPVKLPDLYLRCAAILNKAVGRQLNSVECSLLIDEAAVTIVAGNVRRSAGIRQFAFDDQLGGNAKNNLWQQDENGNWRIDPDRDALRMANHTRIFHHKPTLEECIAAVRKQYYSGEGAIMWAGESVARANGDLLQSREQKTDFLLAYSQGKSREWLRERYPNIAPEELEHRLARVGLNPCLSDDTWILTENGAQKIKDLLGKQVGLFVNGELFSTTKEGFYETGVKRLYRLTTKEGYEIRATDNHPFLKITAQTQKKQYSEWTELKDLSVGDRVSIHNHKGIQPWWGDGTFGEGWLLGSLVGDGNFTVCGRPEKSVSEKYSKQTAVLRYWGDNQAQMGDYAAALIKEELGSQLTAIAYPCSQYTQVRGVALYKLAKRFGMKQRHKTVTPAVERASYDFYSGFLQGFFDADGSVEGGQQRGASVRLYRSDLNVLKAVQRMLLRLGIASKLYQHRPEHQELLPDGKGGQKLYNCKAAHVLSVSRANLKEFHAIVGFSDPDKKAKLDALLCKQRFCKESFTVRVSSIEFDGIEPVYDCTVPGVSRFDANGFVVHNCGEIVGANFFCNLSEIHLNQIDPHNYQEQADAFTAGALSVATLLNHKFVEPRYRDSRELDPIVGVSFTGLFDFFVNAFGVDWLHWWKEGRPELHGGLEYKQREIEYLSRWKEIVHRVVWDYCDRHSLKCPNRCTTCQPSGTKSLLTGASPGWHPPKAQRFIRRVTFAKNDPVALACIDYGYNVVPSQSDKDENGNLLHDPFSPMCSEWLVEIPVAVPWADLPGADAIDIAKFSAIAQMDFYLTVQRYWTTHNSSATIELRENEIEALGTRIYEAISLDEGYISAALLARFGDHQSFPRLPFEPIDKQQYDLLMKEVQMRRQTDDFQAALSRYDSGYAAVGPEGCDSDKCLFPSQRKIG